MKILFFTENFPPETNAAATRVYERACYWIKWGHEVTVITCAPNFPGGKLFHGYKNKWRQKETVNGINVVRVKTFIAPNKGTFLRTLDFLSFLVSGFIAILFQERPDVVAATSPQFFAAIAGWAAGKTRHVPFVFELGDLWPASIAAVGAMRRLFLLRLVEKVELYLYRQSASIVALTRPFKDNLSSRGVDSRKIAVVMNGFEISRYRPQMRDGDFAAEWNLHDCFVIGYVGTHGMAHGLQNVLNAAALLQAEPKFRFLLAGAGAEREQLFEEAKNRRLNNIVFLPPQPKEKMPTVWSLCDAALVHLRNAEVFSTVIPSKIFEAMGMGLPLLLVSPEGEASRIIKSEETGIWVQAEDPKALAACALRLMNNEKERLAFAVNSLKAAPLHSRERQALLMMTALDMAAHGKGGEAGLVVSP